jgi:hypothetical protein
MAFRVSKTHKIDEGTSFRVYDNGGKTTDRYTVILVGSDWKDQARRGFLPMLGLSEGGRAFSQFGEAQEGPHLGKPIAFSSLDHLTQRHILERLTDWVGFGGYLQGVRLPTQSKIQGRSEDQTPNDMSQGRTPNRLSYGTLPTRAQFFRAFEREAPNGYNITHGSPARGRMRPPEGRYSAQELWAEVQRLQRGSSRGNEEAGDWASSILGTLGFEWV